MTKRHKTIISLFVLLISIVGIFTVYSLYGRSIISKAESVLEKKKSTEYFKVSDLKVDKTLVNSVTLSWNKLSKADGYNIFKYDYISGKWINIADTHKNNTEYTVVGLNGGLEYRFAVNGYTADYNEVANSAESLAEITAVTNIFDVSGISVSSSKGIHKISWNESSGADGYIIYYWDNVNNSFVEKKKTLLTYSFIYEIEEAPKLVAVKAYKYIGETQSQSENYCVLDLATSKKSLTVYAEGDSIAYGAGASGYSYADILRDGYGFGITKTAVNGSTFAQNISDEKDITKRVLKNFNTDYDYALIEGGVNDYYFSMPLGEVSEPLTEEFDTATTCGGLESIFYHIRKASPDTRIYFLVTHKTNNFDSVKNKLGLTYLDYYNAILNICSKYCVSVIDCHEDCALDTSDEAMKKAYTVKKASYPDGDGIHPNLEGYKKYYMPAILSALKIKE